MSENDRFKFQAWKDQPTTTGYYFIDDSISRSIVHYDIDNHDVSHQAGIAKLHNYKGFKWWGPIPEPKESEDE